MKKLTVKDIQDLKGKRKITKVTALNYYSAKVIEEVSIDIIGLDGPPVEIYYKGEIDSLKANLGELIFCLKALRRGALSTFIAVPIPFNCIREGVKVSICAAKDLIYYRYQRRKNENK